MYHYCWRPWNPLRHLVESLRQCCHVLWDHPCQKSSRSTQKIMPKQAPSLRLTCKGRSLKIQVFLILFLMKNFKASWWNSLACVATSHWTIHTNNHPDPIRKSCLNKCLFLGQFAKISAGNPKYFWCCFQSNPLSHLHEALRQCCPVQCDHPCQISSR